MGLYPKSFIPSGEFLSAGDYLQSPNRQYFALMQDDGNFCVDRGSGPSDKGKMNLWCARNKSLPKGKYFAMMQDDGNLSIHHGKGPSDKQGFVWCARDKSEPTGAYFAMLEDDGNFCIYSGSGPSDKGKLVWKRTVDLSTKNATTRPQSFIPSGEFLATGDYLQSPNRLVFAIMQDDGQFCIYRGSGPDDKQKVFQWSARDKGGPKGAYFAILQPDGQFCTYRGSGPGNKQGDALWSTSERDKGAYFAMMQDDGSFCIYRGTGPGDQHTLVWSVTPPLPSDFSIIEHKTNPPPDPGSTLYLTITEEQESTKRIFNNQTDYENEEAAKIQTRKIMVSGVRIILEKGSERYPLFDGLHDKSDIGQLTLCADEIIVRSPLHLPGTELRIYARILSFEGQASFDTTPKEVTARARTREEGLKGQAAGDIYLYVSQINVGTVKPRFIAQGAKGQAARLGEPGAQGSSMPIWPGDAETWTQTGHDNVNWKKFWSNLQGYEPVYVEISGIFDSFQAFTSVYADALHAVSGEPWSRSIQTRGEKKWPSDGEPPRKMPGRPGQGGDGGSIFSNARDLSNLCDLKSGEPGAMAEYIKPAGPGTPLKSCWVVARWEYNRFSNNEPKSLGILDVPGGRAMHEAKPGPEAKPLGPNPATAGKPGTIKPLPVSDPAFWIHPAAVRALTGYVRDTWLAGHEKTGRDALEPYLQPMATSNRDLEFATLSAEVVALAQAIDGPYDYFGNPAGWTPMLSFESNLQLYEQERDSAIRILFLAYWIEKKATSDQKAFNTLKAAIERIDAENTATVKDYNAALEKLNDLNAQSGNLVVDIDSFKRALIQFEQEEEKKVKNDSQLEYTLRGSANMLGGVMQLIPAYQPVLGAAGKGLTVLSEIDLQKPTASLPDLAGAFKPVAEEQLQQKAIALAKALYGYPKKDGDAQPTLPTTESDSKKLDPKAEEKKLEDKVKKHVDALKKATAQVPGWLAKFSAPESVIKERLAKVLADCPQYKELVKKVEELNEKKARISKELLAVTEAIDKAATTLAANQLARINMSAQLGITLKQLNHDAAQYAKSMGQRARARLLKYQYYLLKSYQYHMLEDYTKFDFTVQELFKKFSEMLSGSPDGTLTQDQYKTLASVFEDQLRQLVNKVIEYYEHHPIERLSPFVVSLSPSQLETLNGRGLLTLDLMEMGYLDLSQEDIRITDIKVAEVELDSPPPNQAVNVNLTFRHAGTSRLRKGGRLYLFRTGNYSVSANDEHQFDYADTHMFWRTVVTHRGGKYTITASIPNPKTVSLLHHLIGEGGNDDRKRARNDLLSYSPAAWGDLSVQRTMTKGRISYKGKIMRLDLEITCSASNLNPDYATVFVRGSDETLPLIRCNITDLNGRGDSEGSFLRTFDTRRTSSVTLSAPASFGNRKFSDWKIEDQLGTERNGLNMTLDLSGDRRTFDIEAVFEKPVEVTASRSQAR